MTSNGMLAVLAAAITCALAATPADRQSIASLVSAFNAAVKVNDLERLSTLFTKDADYAEGSATPISARAAIRQFSPKRLPWDERTALTMRILNISFFSPDKATVDAVQSDYAPMLGISRRWACRFGVVRTGSDWRISSYRESVVSDAGIQ